MPPRLPPPPAAAAPGGGGGRVRGGAGKVKNGSTTLSRSLRESERGCNAPLAGVGMSRLARSTAATRSSGVATGMSNRPASISASRIRVRAAPVKRKVNAET